MERTEKLNIYKNERQLEYELKRLEKAQMSERNKDAIRRYHKHLLAKNVGNWRVARLCMGLRTLSKRFKKDFEDATKADIEGLVSEINQAKEYSAATQSDFKQIIKQFYKFLKGDGLEFPPEVKWIKTSIKMNQQKRFEDMLSPEEIKGVVFCCNNPRDKAFISLLYETGARIGEVLNMRIKDFTPTDKYAKVRLFGKTGERRVTIVSSVNYINKYLEKHPYKNDFESFLWLSEGSYHNKEPILYVGAVKIIKRAFNNAGLKKRFNPHIFRHSRATELAPHLTEVQMSLYFGWVLGTRQVRNYVHASGKEVDESILKLNGIETKTTEEQLISIRCHRCGTLNKGSNFCNNCGYALDVPSAMKIEEQMKQETNKAFELLLEISKNPELMKEFEEFRRKMPPFGC